MNQRGRPESHRYDGPEESPRSLLAGYAWAIGGVAGATLLFWLLRDDLDKNQAPLLYLPVVIVCATRFGFGPAVVASIGSFFCWNYFFLPPFGTWTVEDPKDWLSLFVFLAVAVFTARLAAQARAQTREAQAREQEARALQRASEQISGEVATDRILPSLARQLVAACAASSCAIYRADGSRSEALTLAARIPGASHEAVSGEWLARTFETGQPSGFRSPASAAAPAPSPDDGVFAPLIADGRCRGVVHVGPRQDGHAFSRPQERLILALANHAAVALARQALSDEAAQAQALRDADVLKNTLLSLVSHELRTPLAAIKASATGLLQGGADWDPAALEEALTAINDESDRLGELVSKLLDLSRLEAGAWKPEMDWCDLVDALGIALARLPSRDGARVRIDAPAELPLIRADFVQIAQVMTNLLENALKYSSPQTDVTVTLRAEEGDVRVDVADSGPGIPPGEAEAIFERFHRLDRHRRSGLPGTGLGLAICRGIVEAHGGRIWEHNAPGGGSVFSFLLPLPTASPRAEPGEDSHRGTVEEAASVTHAHPGR